MHQTFMRSALKASDSETEDQSEPDDVVESSEMQIVAPPRMNELNSQEELWILGASVVLIAIQPLTREARWRLLRSRIII